MRKSPSRARGYARLVEEQVCARRARDGRQVRGRARASRAGASPITPRSSRLQAADDADAWAHERVPQPPPPVPAKEIALAVGLLAAGTTFLALSGLIAQGRLPGAAPGAGWGLLVLGLLAALPGFYVTRIAYHAARGRPGFSFGDIPRG